MWLWLRRNSFSSTLRRLLSRHEYHRAHVFADLEGFSAGGVQPQQVLREQDAENLIAILADDREARVAGLHREFDQLVRRRVALDEHHLRPGHHDIAHLHVGHRQHAFEHDQRVAVEQAARTGLAQILDELGEIARFAGHRLRNAL